MKKLLVVVDMQNDFVSGVLGSKEACAIVSQLSDKIKAWDGDLAVTLDTHGDDYYETVEGKKLPVAHCVRGTEGWKLVDLINDAVDGRGEVFKKDTFGSLALCDYIKKGGYEYIEFTGVCTDICVISNVMLAKAALPNAHIVVDQSCCAGVTPQSHKTALSAMAQCHIEII